MNGDVRKIVMEALSDKQPRLPERHRLALKWFHENAGTQQTWPQPLADGTLLAARAKGIYKPSWSEYALSVRETLPSPYPDEEPVSGPDGSWTYRYFQESRDLKDRDILFTNRSLLACVRDRIPGVMRQTQKRPRVHYHVLGLALVVAWEKGFFILKGVDHGQGPREFRRSSHP